MTPTMVKTVRATPWRARLGEAGTVRAVEAKSDPSAAFAEYVRGRLDGPVLRYSQRLALLKEAARRGVGRFEANLVIASVLHGRGMAQEYEMRPASGWRGALVAGAIVQAVLVVGAWWVFH